MKLWRWILLLVIIAALAAFGWHWVAVDPGFVLVRLRGWEVQSTLLTAVIIVVIAVLIVVWAWLLLRWSIGAAGRHYRRVSRRYLHTGLTALAEGRYGTAERSLTLAARHRPQRGVAWLGAAQAAAHRGDQSAAFEMLDKAAVEVPEAARVVRARMLRHAGKAQAAMNLLAPGADARKLTPAGWVEWVKAVLAIGDPVRARTALEPLRKSGALDANAQTALEARVLVAAIQTAADGAALKALWTDMPKIHRRRVEAVDAYARRAAYFGQSMAAMGEVEAALRRQWSPALAETWGLLDGEVEARLRRAEAWLDTHPDDPALLTTLGRLSAQLEVWGKAREYLGHALAIAPSAATWEALGEVYAGQDNLLLSQRCYRNALRMGRGDPVEPLPGQESGGALKGSVSDQRDAHGMPHLPE